VTKHFRYHLELSQNPVVLDFFGKQIPTMLVLLAIVSLLFVHNAHSALMAKAKVHSSSDNDCVGYVMFIQNDGNSPVTIKGRFWNMTPSTVHVSLENSQSQRQGKPTVGVRDILKVKAKLTVVC
jgi:hypothetical protein